ncbi:uncharacterized protein LOC144043587 [Vanacampus margaritifer]
MNGAVYIPFFQGQLESVLEQVVQLAVHEISSTVGSSLNALLLEAAVQEQENRRLRLRLQAWESRRGHDEGGTEEHQEAAAGDNGPDGCRTKPEQPADPRAATRGPTDTRRLEQRGRVVEQLKCVMERVLHSSLCQLKKMVEASFDDLLLEITQKECERQTLQARLNRRHAGVRWSAQDDTGSLGSSEDAPKDAKPAEAEEAGGGGGGGVHGTKDKADTVALGHEWCGDIWKLKGSAGGGGSSEGLTPVPPPVMALTVESSPLQDPRWTPLEDMDVLSPDQDAAPPPTPLLSPSGNWGVSSSASMLQRLLTASQLPDDHAGGAHKKPQATTVTPAGQDAKQQQDEDEDDDDQDEEDDDDEEEGKKGRKKKRRKVWSECEDCGRRFSRVLLLKAHRQTHAEAAIGVSPPQCSRCGKSFSSAGRLRSHLQAKHQS